MKTSEFLYYLSNAYSDNNDMITTLEEELDWLEHGEASECKIKGKAKRINKIKLILQRTHLEYDF